MDELVDSHCHLDAPQFDADRQAVIARAAENGVAIIVDPGIDLPSSRAAVALAQQHENVYAAVGVHPHDAKTLDEETRRELRKLATSPKVVAIGEIGLDYYRDLSPREAQRAALVWQLELAAELELPVILHDRDAHDDVLAMLTDWHSALGDSHPARAARPGVLHSFSGDETLARQLVALGFWIGISGPVTYRNAERLRGLVRAMPAEKLLVETDGPYLPPHPYRGKRNEPAYVRLVAQAVADARGAALERVAYLTSANARDLFGWPGDRHS